MFYDRNAKKETFPNGRMIYVLGPECEKRTFLKWTHDVRFVSQSLYYGQDTLRQAEKTQIPYRFTKGDETLEQSSINFKLFQHRHGPLARATHQ